MNKKELLKNILPALIVAVAVFIGGYVVLKHFFAEVTRYCMQHPNEMLGGPSSELWINCTEWLGG